MLLLMDLLATYCFACTGALVALRARMRAWQVVLAAMLTSVGGGTTRDLLLGSDQLFWLLNPNYLLVIGSAILFAIVFSRQRKYSRRNGRRKGSVISRPFCRALDATGTSVFIVVGVLAAIRADCSLPAIVLAGMFTGIGGGLIRQLVLETEFVAFRNFANAVTALIMAFVCSFSLLNYFDPLLTILAAAAIHPLLLEIFSRMQTKRKTARTFNWAPSR